MTALDTDRDVWEEWTAGSSSCPPPASVVTPILNLDRELQVAGRRQDRTQRRYRKRLHVKAGP